MWQNVLVLESSLWLGHMRCHPKRQWRGINPPPNHRVASAVSLSKQLNQRSPSSVSLSEEEFNIASYLLMLSYATPSSSSERFECGGSKKVFVSHHALGGHRASHRNVKGCFAITNVTGDPMTVTTTSSDQDHQGKIVMFSGHHKCNICFRMFSSGQALRGHAHEMSLREGRRDDGQWCVRSECSCKNT